MAITVSQLIASPADPGPYRGLCSICGISGSGQYDRNDILDKTSANLTAIFDMNQSTICRFCVGVWREPKKFHRAIYADPEGLIFPVISRDSATEDRPVWSDIVRMMPVDQPRVMILTTDPKKRTWPMARVSQGDLCAIYTHDPSRGISGNIWVSIEEMRRVLNVIERAYEAGFSKPAISTSLYTSHKQATIVGLEQTRQMEHQLAWTRTKAEFIPSLIIAQKGNNEPT